MTTGQRNSSPRRVMVAGGSGLIGRHLCHYLLDRGDEVLILTRNPAAVSGALSDAALIPWTPGELDPWVQDLDGVDALVDMAGAPFFTRWKGDYYVREVLGSRIRCTETLVQAIASVKSPPSVFVSGSSVGVYGYQRSEEPVTEDTPAGDDFWGQDSLALEQRADAAEQHDVRVVHLRTGIVLAPDGGILAGQLSQCRHGFGGVVLPGSQWFPWSTSTTSADSSRPPSIISTSADRSTQPIPSQSATANTPRRLRASRTAPRSSPLQDGFCAARLAPSRPPSPTAVGCFRRKRSSTATGSAIPPWNRHSGL